MYTWVCSIYVTASLSLFKYLKNQEASGGPLSELDIYEKVDAFMRLVGGSVCWPRIQRRRRALFPTSPVGENAHLMEGSWGKLPSLFSRTVRGKATPRLLLLLLWLSTGSRCTSREENGRSWAALPGEYLPAGQLGVDKGLMAPDQPPKQSDSSSSILGGQGESHSSLGVLGSPSQLAFNAGSPKPARAT